MAKTILLECDRCGGSSEVKSISSFYGPIKIEVDLCKPCFSKMIHEYGFRSSQKGNRRTFEVVDEADIK